MNEVILVGKYYTAIDGKGKYNTNLVRRLNAILDHHFPDTIYSFSIWKYEGQLNDLSLRIDRCLCGKCIFNFYVISYQQVFCVIGSDCILKFLSHLEDEHKLELRTTFDCKVCDKRISKDNLEHGKCNRCDEDIQCIYRVCYKCKFPVKNLKIVSVCEECGVGVNEVWKKLCGSCWYKNEN